MSKKEEFKIFVSKHPSLINYIKSGDMTWQKFYEIYDLYGSDETKWSAYLKSDNDRKISSKFNIGEITNLVKKVDMNSIQKHINTAQKAIGLFQEFGTKGTTAGIAGLASKAPTAPRPINKFFED